MQEPIFTGIISDYELIRRILQGEKNLYTIIVLRHNEHLYRIAMAIIINNSEVEDVMQVAYLKAYENLGKFSFKSSFSTWLTRKLINECLLHLKKTKRPIKINNDKMNGTIYQPHLADTQTPVAKMLNAELKKILEKAISQLPEKYRMVFVMREIEQMNVAEIMDCLDISEATVKTKLNRAKVLLRNLLSDYNNGEDILHFHFSRCNRIAEKVMKQIDIS